MNDEAIKLLESIASKLGTTTEYLWNVLLSEAKYDAIVSIIQLTIMTVFIYFTIKLHIKFCKEIDDKNSIYYDNEYTVGLPMIFAAIISAIFIFIILMGLPELISSIFNPEYWALKRILRNI